MTTAPSLLDQLKNQQAPPAPGSVMLSPEQQAQMAALPDAQRAQLESLIANPPPGMDPQKVVEMVLAQAAPTPTPVPAPTPVPTPVPAPAPASGKGTKAERNKLINSCAQGGLSIAQVKNYLDLLG